MKENVSPVVIAVVVILAVAVVAFFGFKIIAPNRNAEPTADQMKQHMGAGIPQTGGMGRPGGPGGSSRPYSSGSSPGGSSMPYSSGSSPSGR